MPELKRAIGLVAALAVGWSLSPLGCGGGDQTSTDNPTAGGGFGNGPTSSAGGSGQGGGDCASSELCNGVDDNCDGQVDEGCACIEGDTQACWSGPAGLEGIGQCAAGTQTCDVNGSWGACENEVLPDAEETCDGIDNDCNDEVDEGFGSLSCGLGICQVTVDECTNGVPNPCIPGMPNPSETCDGTDDDCDGQVDEGCTCVNGMTQPCYSGSPSTQNVGACTDGTQTCAGGVWGSCQNDVTPTTETCNNIDDDCDGQTDENNPDGGAMCNTGQFGICSAGTQTCVNGSLSCVQNNMATTEICNGLDDDCDGQADDGNPGGGGMCSTGLLGVCLPGTFVCQGGMLGCVQNVTPSAEICNGLDDDCDGMTDEGNPGGGGNCTTTQFGVCAAGTQQCQGGQLVCVSINMPSAEVCNGLDDDCDNATDEGDPGGGGNCTTANLGVCAQGTQHCTGGQIVCQQNVNPSPETCNGLDDDCDGMTDENNPGGGGSCNSGQLGICAAGTQTCQNGSLTCVANNMPGTEACNGLDDDCDGMTDEGNPGGGGNCITGQPGICSAGTQMCQGGSLQCIANQMPVPEICNNLDDDCDGAIDDGNPGGGSSCSTGNQGVCAAGTMTCQAGMLNCVQNVSPSSENCSNGLDDDCDGLTDGNDPDCGCAHALCTTGVALTSSCSTCVATICAVDSFCCDSSFGSWDSLCVEEVRTECGSLTCSESAGTCPHTLCTAGPASTPFTSGCDSGQANCVATICGVDPYCCSTDWDSFCVSEVASECSLNCTYM